MCSSLKGLLALASRDSYKHYTFKELANHSKKGCLMCANILEALKELALKMSPGNLPQSNQIIKLINLIKNQIMII